MRALYSFDTQTDFKMVHLPGYLILDALKYKTLNLPYAAEMFSFIQPTERYCAYTSNGSSTDSYDKNKEYENYLIIDNVLFFNKGKATGACNSISVP